MKVLFAASEAVPFIKTGGLADVIGSLPKELIQQGLDVRVILPKYGGIPAKYREAMTTAVTHDIYVGWRKQYIGIQVLQQDGVTFYFVDNEFYFNRSGVYGYGDEAERFAFFCKGVIETLPLLDFQPDVIHCHDWQASMIPVLLKAHYQHLPFYSEIKTLTTVHNLKYQGVFSQSLFKELFGLSEDHFTGTALELHGGASFLKGGLLYADRITTVSQTYAEEIQTPYFGEHLDSLLRHRRDQLTGIVNGIDYEVFDPMNDPHLVSTYRDSLPKKQLNKTALQERLGLEVREDVPMIALVTRLVQQKGLDLIQHVLPEILSLDIQLVVLGTGEYDYEEMFKQAALKHPGKVSAQICFDEALAHQIYAASDLFLMPSQFEPCGIGQLIALRYRSVPIVRETGGLKDTVLPYNEFTGEGTGFSFRDYNAHDMLHTIRRAVFFYKNDRDAWLKIQMNMKKGDFSWKKSAQQYIGLYKEMVK
ncbi:glycogen synthase GlgA [Paenibacillus sp. CGMCC 1.16610]|uniref:Glycogen synthase n=1 Tax=Paenibacillus anseongense TaxID=2682845 RepID=A0ABW9UFG9_9BACL|nr:MULTISPECIES: glycogen synthase GlgA [Paenibacillus]MBA2939949.1 glycogen synthase GlgA [Paenibacillus sp. CGMCC 1.16610]MVQ38904.1 glycogen synthase GlgA [Paenibacillus anseongense]